MHNDIYYFALGLGVVLIGEGAPRRRARARRGARWSRRDNTGRRESPSERRTGRSNYQLRSADDTLDPVTLTRPIG